MGKTVLAVIAGFILWSILWVGSDALLVSLSPSWYGEGLKHFSQMILAFSLLRSIGCSLIAGYLAGKMVGHFKLAPPLALGLLLLAFGLFVQSQYWHLIPLWYHLAFLSLLIPFTLLGARLAKGAKSA